MQLDKVPLFALVAVPLLGAVACSSYPADPEWSCRNTRATILKSDGAAWTAQPSGNSCRLAGVWGSDSRNVWAVGEAGTIVKYDGTSWSVQPSGTTKGLYAFQIYRTSGYRRSARIPDAVRRLSGLPS